jgi:DNA-binding beta-propeller fold protein YncE
LYLASLAVALASCKKTHAIASEPVAIPYSRAAYITDNGSDTIAVIDRDGDAVVTRSVDIDPSAHEAPHHLAIDSHGHVFVALAFPPDTKPDPKDKHAGHGGSDSLGELLRLDQRTLSVEATHGVDQNPGDVVLTHDESRVLVTHFDMRRAMQQAKAGASASAMYARLVVLDAKSLDVIAARPVCVAPHGIAITRDDKTAVIACYGSDEIALVDLTTNDLAVAHVPLGAGAGAAGAPRFGPYSVAIADDGKRAIACDLEGADMRVIDLATRQLQADSSIALGARAMMADIVSADEALVPLQGPDGLARVDFTKGAVTARVSFGAECKNPHVARIAPDRRAFVVCEGDHVGPGAVIEVDPVTLAIKKRWVVGVYPDGIVFGR